MVYEDDEPIAANSTVSADDYDFKIDGKTTMTLINKTEAPQEETNFKVLIEIMGAGFLENRPGVDLVTVLDISGSMGPRYNSAGEDRIALLKTAMLFVIGKLSPVDRLSVVVFNNRAKRLCPLLQTIEKSQTRIKSIINGLVCGGRKDILAGLKEGLQVLNDRRLTTGRLPAIMLISDGQQEIERLPNFDVPVYTFGVGQQQGRIQDFTLGGRDIIEGHKGFFSKNLEWRAFIPFKKFRCVICITGVFQKILRGDRPPSPPFRSISAGQQSDPKVLQAIAQNSLGGTFSDVQKDNLSLSFSMCLAGLLTVVVQDLTLTLTQVESVINKDKVSAGNYPKTGDSESVTISFGDLYDRELRRVSVDLHLPAVHSAEPNSVTGASVLGISYSYSASNGKRFRSALTTLNISRVEGLVVPEGEEAEVKYTVRTVDMLNQNPEEVNKKSETGREIERNCIMRGQMHYVNY